MDPNNPKFKEFLNLKDQMDANEKYINDQTKSAEEKIKEFDEQFHEEVVDTNLPHLSNLNEDPQLNGKVLFPLLKENTFIGKKKLDCEHKQHCRLAEDTSYYCDLNKYRYPHLAQKCDIHKKQNRTPGTHQRCNHICHPKNCKPTLKK